MNLPQFSIKRPVTIIVIMLIFITIGIISVYKLPMEMFPDISFPGLMVFVPYPSSSPEEIERVITKPLEDILSTLNNLESISSTSSSSRSSIFIQFKEGTNMDMASMEVRDKLDIVRDKLPDDVEDINIRRWSTSDMPVLRFSIAMKGNIEKLYIFSENILKPELERIEGVANVEIRGLREKQLTITINPDKFYTSSVNILDLLNTIRNNNLNISAGYIDQGEKRFIVRIPGELKVVKAIMGLNLNDKGLKIKDIADVKYDYPERRSYNRLNGKNSLSVRIYKSSTANVVDVCEKVKKVVSKLKENNPEFKNIDTFFYRDQSREIKSSLRDLSFAGIIGGVLAILTLLFFLRKFRTTIIIGIAIPMAIVFTFSFMYLLKSIFSMNLSINVVSLSGLMMAVGMLVDNGVVVLENIFRLKQDKGYNALNAAIIGSTEVTLAVTASTLTTLVVFVSLIFLGSGGFGRWMKDFALTITLALISSLLVSLTFIPLAGSRFLKGKLRKKAKWLVFITSKYEKIISFTVKNVKNKLITIFSAFLIFIISIAMFANIDKEYFPRSEERQIDVTVYMPSFYSLDKMLDMFKGFERILEKNKEKFSIDNYTTYMSNNSKRRGRYTGEISLYLKDTGKSVKEIKEELKKILPKIAGVEYEFGEMRGRGGHSSGMSVELIGEEFSVLTELVPKVVEKLRTIDEIEDVSSDLEGGDVQLYVKVNRKKAESSGVDTRRIASILMTSISDRPIGKFKTENKEIDIIMKLQKPEGFTTEDLKNISLNSMGKRIPISAVSNMSFGMGSMSIRKENKKSKLRIRYNIKKGGMSKVSQKVSKVMNSIVFPQGYSWSFGSNWRRFRQSQQGSMLSVLLAILFIYIIMASLFESFIHPFTILLTVPLALFGVALFFTLTGITLNMASYLGLLTLFGIVVNNGIILVDHIRNLRKKGIKKNKAIVQAGKDRLRPILMTAITTIFGVLPLALPALLPGLFPAAKGRSAMWSPISVAILGGLTTSTFLTLIILPTFYSIFDSLVRILKGIFGYEHKI